MLKEDIENKGRVNKKPNYSGEKFQGNSASKNLGIAGSGPSSYGKCRLAFCLPHFIDAVGE